MTTNAGAYFLPSPRTMQWFLMGILAASYLMTWVDTPISTFLKNFSAFLLP
jgi:hypothetical protein